MPEIFCLWAGALTAFDGNNLKHLRRRIRLGNWASGGMLIEQWHCRPDVAQARFMQGHLTRLICFDRHDRFDHRDFRVMAAGTSTVWAFYVKVAVPNLAGHGFRRSGDPNLEMERR